MLKRITVILLLFIPFNSFSQTACIDSFENKSLYNDRFKYITIGIPPPISGSDSSVIYNSGLHLIKKNISNGIEWIKKMAFLNAARLTSSSNEITGVFANEAGGPAVGSRGIYKLAANGDLLWSKKIQISIPEFQDYGYLAKAKQGNNNDIILGNAVLNKVSITILNSDATVVKLTKNFTVSLPPGEDFITGEIAVINNSLYIFAITDKYQNIPFVERSNLLMMKLNYTTGEVKEMKYLHSEDLFTGTHPQYGNFILNGAFSSNMNVRAIENNYFIVTGRKCYNLFDNSRLYAIKIDTNLNVIKNKVYSPPKSHTYFRTAVTTTSSIDEKGNVLFARLRDSVSNFTNGPSNSCYYFTTDSDLNITMQRYIDIKETGLNSGGFGLNAVPFLKWNNNAEIVFHTYSSQKDSVLHIVQIPLLVKDAPCRGGDFSYISVENPSITQLPVPQITNINAVTINITPYNIVLQNDVVEKRKFCIQKSICDTIKIKGNPVFCLPNDTANFTLFKNPQCLRKTKWLTDTTAVKIIAQPNDTTIKVKFLRPYSGYIRAAFEGCVLQDSFFIQVAAPKQRLYLGKDSMLCPGKTITLNAGVGFKTYRWQDESPNNSFTVSTPGNYFVEATDSCNNVFRDTIIIKPIDVAFNLTYPNPICLYDTASIKVNPLLENFVWTPATSGSYQNNTLKFFPTSSTLYNVTAERLPGCLLSDTVLIKVTNCPIYIFVPTAFSPNNDGNNDVFKPLISGRILSYRFNIYNRYGQLIFTTTETGKGWDGTINGSAQNSGSYVWTCSYQFMNQPAIFKKGTVMLIR